MRTVYTYIHNSLKSYTVYILGFLKLISKILKSFSWICIWWDHAVHQHTWYNFLEVSICFFSYRNRTMCTASSRLQTSSASIDIQNEQKGIIRRFQSSLKRSEVWSSNVIFFILGGKRASSKRAEMENVPGCQVTAEQYADLWFLPFQK